MTGTPDKTTCAGCGEAIPDGSADVVEMPSGEVYHDQECADAHTPAPKPVTLPQVLCLMIAKETTALCKAELAEKKRRFEEENAELTENVKIAQAAESKALDDVYAGALIAYVWLGKKNPQPGVKVNTGTEYPHDPNELLAWCKENYPAAVVVTESVNYGLVTPLFAKPESRPPCVTEKKFGKPQIASDLRKALMADPEGAAILRLRDEIVAETASSPTWTDEEVDAAMGITPDDSAQIAESQIPVS
jgi:hypothetical protein